MIGQIEGFLAQSKDGKKSRVPACQDRWQSITGFVLACFMLCHMVFTATIICGDDAFNAVVHFAEPFGLNFITNLVALVILAALMIHAFCALRKFPGNYKQYLQFRAHKIRMSHCDTTLWWFQFLTGFSLFFLASAHLIDIVVSSEITAANSRANFTGLMEVFYIVLLVAVVVHAAIGMYRLYVKWVSIDGRHKEDRQAKRKQIKTVVFVAYGLLFAISLIADLFFW